MKLAVIGLGLIGGSMALDLKKNNFVEEIYGVDLSNLSDSDIWKKENFETILKKYDWEKIVDQTTALYKKGK